VNANDAARAAAIVRDIAEGVVVARPSYRAASVLECPQCGHRFAIANQEAAETRTWACKCGGTAKVRGFYARLAPIRKAAGR
jgi:ribosomal protein S27AE